LFLPYGGPGYRSEWSKTIRKNPQSCMGKNTQPQGWNDGMMEGWNIGKCKINEGKIRDGRISVDKSYDL